MTDITELNPADIAYGLLREHGRRDLADTVHVFEDHDGTWYLETDLISWPLSDADDELLDKVSRIVTEAMTR